MAPPPRPPFGFRSLVFFLLLASFGTIAWRGGFFPSLGESHRASSVIGGAKQGKLALGAAASTRRRSSALAPGTRDLEGEQLAVQRYIHLGLPLFCGAGNRKYVALTFDDGPGPYTAKTLEILDHAHARATFFLVGRNLAWYPGRAELEAPTHAVGDHTWTHAYLTRLELADQQKEIDDTRRAIAEATLRQVLLFRPPGGFHTPTIDQLISANGMLEVMWSADSMDSAGATTPQVLHNSVAGLKPGAIILMHENRGTTLQMLPRLLKEIARLGLQTVTVPELLRLDPPTAEQMQENAAARGCVS
jgi:peptidoglycan/xylan/chitin deacetylase (PgdA/CDA1 family)